MSLVGTNYFNNWLPDNKWGGWVIKKSVPSNDNNDK